MLLGDKTMNYGAYESFHGMNVMTQKMKISIYYIDKMVSIVIS